MSAFTRLPVCIRIDMVERGADFAKVFTAAPTLPGTTIPRLWLLMLDFVPTARLFSGPGTGPILHFSSKPGTSVCRRSSTPGLKTNGSA